MLDIVGADRRHIGWSSTSRTVAGLIKGGVSFDDLALRLQGFLATGTNNSNVVPVPERLVTVMVSFDCCTNP